MFFVEDLHSILAYTSANLVLTKGIWLKVAIQDDQVYVRVVKHPKKVSILFLEKKIKIFTAHCSEYSCYS